MVAMPSLAGTIDYGPWKPTAHLRWSKVARSKAMRLQQRFSRAVYKFDPTPPVIRRRSYEFQWLDIPVSTEKPSGVRT